jgi:hypothetical protein
MSESTSLREHFTHYATLVVQRSMLQAIDLYYHDDIIQYENDGEPLKGKAFLRAKEVAVGKNMKSLKVIIKNVIIDEINQKASGRMIFEFESVELGKNVLDEAFVQQWSDGQIIDQKFNY